jgi:hypothetical protein
VIGLTRLLVPVVVLLMLTACGGVPGTRADPTEQAVTAEAVIAATATASWIAEPAPESRGDMIAFWRDG